MVKKHLYLASTIFVVAAHVSTLAHAQGSAGVGTQQSGTSDNQGLADIVITAQRRAENLQDVPIAVTALSTTELAGASIQGQLSLPKLTPNLNFTIVSAFASTYIRGVGTQFANPGLESSVSVYFDDIYIPRAGSAQFSFHDIERIEVLKGPQGTLYGRNATGGAIRIITVDPKPDFEGKASVTYGTDNRLQIDGVLNLPIAEGVALRLAAKHDENDGYSRNVAPNAPQRRFQNRNEELYTAKLLIEPADNFRIKLSGDYSRKDDREGVAFWNLFPAAPEQIGAVLGGCVSPNFYDGCNDSIAQNKITQYGGELRIDVDFDTATVSSITGYRYEREYGRSDLDGTGADVQPAAGKPKTTQFTQELQVTSNSGNAINYVAGIYYLRERSQYAFTVFGSAISGGFGPLFPQFTDPVFMGFGGIEAQSFGPFAQLEYELTDRLKLTAGGRYTYERKKLRFNYGGLGQVDRATGFPVPGTFIRAPFGACSAVITSACEAEEDLNIVRKFTPKVTLSFTPIDPLMVYATFSRGFKSGGFNLPSFGAVDSVQPEILDDYEVGFKFQEGPIRFNGAAFYYDYKDLQIQLTDQTTGGTRVKNAAGARIWGVEADLTWAVSSNFEFGAGGGYLDSKYKNFVGDAYVPCGQVAGLPESTPEETVGKQAGLAACAAQGGLGLALVGGQSLSGNRLVNAPKFSGYLRGAYTLPVDGVGTFQLSSILNYRTVAYFDPANRFPDRKRALLSARVQWTSENERYYLALWGENLTDKKYDYSQPAQANGGWRTPAPPRQIYVTAGLNF